MRALVEKGNLLLPHLASVGYIPTPENYSHEVVSIVESEFRLCNLPNLSTTTSALLSLGMFEGENIGVDYHNEAIMLLLVDILKALKLHDKFIVHQQVTQDVNEHGGVFVLSLFGVILLILEINHPAVEVNDRTHRQSLGRVFDNLRVNRECAALGYCFGVWTTYDSCRLIWLNDDAHNALAQGEHMTETFKYSLPPDQYNWNSREVCASKIYKKDDNIPKLLACLIWKLYHSNIESKTMLSREVVSKKYQNVKFRAVNDKGYFFQSNQGTIENLTFRSPHETTKQFYLIRQFNGRDGNVWLSISQSGRLAMVKFRKLSKTFKFLHKEKLNSHADELLVSQVNMSNKDSLLVNSELVMWNRAYKHLNVNPFTVTLANNTALVMPCCFCYDSSGVLQLELQYYLPCERDFAAGFTNWETILNQLQSVDSAEKNLFTAIKTLASKFILHRDIKWEHLALLPVFNKKGLVRLEPILIDLAEVDIMSSETEAITEMCHVVMTSTMLNSDQRASFDTLLQMYQATRQASQDRTPKLQKKRKATK